MNTPRDQTPPPYGHRFRVRVKTLNGQLNYTKTFRTGFEAVRFADRVNTEGSCLDERAYYLGPVLK